MYETRLMLNMDLDLFKTMKKDTMVLEHEKFGTYSINDILTVHYENPGFFEQIQLFEFN